MTIIVENVRNYLNGITEDKLSDLTVQQNINLSEAYVNEVKKSNATTANINNAVLAIAGYYCYEIYADQYRNIASVTFNNGYAIPADGSSLDQAIAISVDKKLESLRIKAETFLGFVTDVKQFLRPDSNKMYTAYIDGSQTAEYIARNNSSGRFFSAI